MAPAIFRKGQFFFKPWGKSFLQPIKGLTKLLVQNEESLQLLQAHGVKNGEVCGDSRFDRVAAIARHNEGFQDLERFIAERPCLVAGSTWPADDAVIFPGLMKLQGHAIILAPHEIREDKLTALEAKLTKPFVRWSTWDGKATQAEILILDVMGMLSRVYRYAGVSYVGGGFTTGIHSILEPAAFGMPLLFGPDHGSFREAQDLINRGAAQSVSDANSFIRALEKALEPGTYEKARQTCRAYVAENEGAARRIQQALQSMLTGKSPEDQA